MSEAATQDAAVQPAGTFGMPIRRMGFLFPAPLDCVFIRNDPWTSYLFLGAWMMLPYLEPYLIRSINEAAERIDDPVLKEECRRFSAQEGHHYREHANANRVIKSMNPRFAALEKLEQEIAAEFKRFSAEKSLRFNVAYAEGFESMTAAMSRTQMELGFFETTDNPLAELGLWHITEELEHRTVAFEVYKKLFGGYFYRVYASIRAQRHFLAWGRRFTEAMLEADPETLRRYDTPENQKEIKQRRSRLMRRGMPRVLATYLPGYSPRLVRMPLRFNDIRARFTRAAMRVS